MQLGQGWDGLDAQKFAAEEDVIASSLDCEPFTIAGRRAVVEQAAGLVEGVRASARQQG